MGWLKGERRRGRSWLWGSVEGREGEELVCGGQLRGERGRSWLWGSVRGEREEGCCCTPPTNIPQPICKTEMVPGSQAGGDVLFCTAPLHFCMRACSALHLREIVSFNLRARKPHVKKATRKRA